MNETIHFRKVFSTDDHNLVISVSVRRSLNSTNLGLNKKRIVISTPTKRKPLYSEPIEGTTRRDTRQSRRIWKPKYWHVSRNKILSRSAYRVLSKLPDNHLALLGWKWRPKQSIDNNVAATWRWKEKELPNTVTCKTTHPSLHLESHSTNIVFGSNSDNTPSTDVKTPELNDSENEASFCSAEDSQHLMKNIIDLLSQLQLTKSLNPLFVLHYLKNPMNYLRTLVKKRSLSLMLL